MTTTIDTVTTRVDQARSISIDVLGEADDSVLAVVYVTRFTDGTPPSVHLGWGPDVDDEGHLTGEQARRVASVLMDAAVLAESS